MDEPFNHREDVWPVPDLDRSEEPEKEEEVQRRAPFGPLGLKLIGSD